MARSDSSITDIKRLFALSGNRCAFPKCRTPVFLDGTLVGKVCHIKGANPGSARFDLNQSNEERNAFANLVVMCGVHHDIIDADEVSYTVDRLMQIKAEHEAGVVPLSEPEVSRITNIYIQTASELPGRKGGRGDRDLQAIERIWNTMVNLRKEFSDVIFVDTIALPHELDAFFSGVGPHPLFDSISHYRDYMAVMRKFTATGAEDAQRERPFLDTRLFSLFCALQGVLARAAMLLHLSFKKRKYQNWRNDDLALGHISSVIASSKIDVWKASNMFSLQNIANEIERLFNEIVRGE